MRGHALQGLLIGFGAAIIPAQVTARIKTKRTNGWASSLGSGSPKNGMLLRGAYALAFPGPISTSEEAMYWTTTVGGNHRSLSGKRNYVMRFPACGLLSNSAF